MSRKSTFADAIGKNSAYAAMLYVGVLIRNYSRGIPMTSRTSAIFAIMLGLAILYATMWRMLSQTPRWSWSTSFMSFIISNIAAGLTLVGLLQIVRSLAGR